MRAGHWRQRLHGLIISLSFPRGCHFGKIWPHPSASRLQCWETPGWGTNRVGTQSHSLAERLPNVALGALSHLYSGPTWPSYKPEWQDPVPLSGEAPVPPTRKTAEAHGSDLFTRGQTPEEGLQPLQLAERRLLSFLRKLDEMKWQMKEHDKSPEEKLSEVGNLHEKESNIMILRMIQGLGGEGNGGTDGEITRNV